MDELQPMDDLQRIQGAWKLEHAGVDGTTYWDVFKDTVTEAGPHTKEPKATRRISLDPLTNRVRLIKLAGLLIENGFYKLDGNELQICLGHNDETNPIDSESGTVYSLTRASDRPSFLMYRPDPISHDALGVLRWGGDWWDGEFSNPSIQKFEISLSPEPDFECEVSLVASFLEWLPSNYDSFIEHAANAFFDCDLAPWDDNLDTARLQTMLKIDTVSVNNGVLTVWFDAGGAVTDHLVQTKLDEAHRIIDMQI